MTDLLQGAIAVKTGNNFENFVIDRLTREGYASVPNTRFFASVVLEQPIYTTQCLVGETIYKTSRKVDFIIYHPQKHPNCLVIENKWQESKGSVDEKYPYLVANIQAGKFESIVLVDGCGYRKGALDWLKLQTTGNLIHVFNMGEFFKWANNPKNI